MRIQQSLCYPLFASDEYDLNHLFAKARAIGYQAAEFWFREEAHDQVIAEAKANGLVIASVCGHTSLPVGLNDVSEHDRIEAELIASIDYAVKYEIPSLITFSGNRLEGQTDEEGLQACAAGLRRVTGYAEKHNINLNMELLNSKVNHKGYLCDHTAWGVALCEEVNSPRVKLLYDIYHMQIMEGDVIRTIRENIQWIGHFHTAGNPDRKDLDDKQELNYRGVCNAIAATGYTGYLGHEFSPKADKLKALEVAFEICNQTA